MRQHNFLFFKFPPFAVAEHLWYRTRGGTIKFRTNTVQSPSCVEQRAFAVEAYFSSGCSVIATQRAFRNRLGLFASPLSRFDILWFFSMGFLKSSVYVNCPRTLQDLKTNIQEEIASIAPAMLAGVMTNARNRFTLCKENGERYLPDVIFKTN